MNIEKSLEIIKAMADGSRLRILHALIEKPYYVEELAARLNVGAPTISFHLKKLEQAGFVKKEKEQYYVMFYVNTKALGITLRELVLIEDNEKGIQDERLAGYRTKVIKTYFKHGKLNRLPSQEKKRKIILDVFADMFNPEKKYSENEINEKIAESFDDYCTVRRELIDRKIMARDGVQYWLIEKPNMNSSQEIVLKQQTRERKMDRKTELKNAYKMNPRQGGVFQVKNLKNGKIFIGSGPNVEGQINKTKFILQLKDYPVDKLQEDWNITGEENFSFEILDYLKLKDGMTLKEYKSELKLLEEMWIEKLKTYDDKGYNLSPALKE